MVVRHAKSDYPLGVPDSHRPLAERGRHDAPLMGRWIAGFVGAVDVAVVSPAVRAQQTWQLLAGAMPQPSEVRSDARIYEAWGSRLVDVVVDLPYEARTAIIVGHEPGVSDLALHLSNQENHKLHRRIASRYPTCGVTVLQSTHGWDEFAPGCARLVEFVAPKDFA